jgi:hypothetical protein
VLLDDLGGRLLLVGFSSGAPDAATVIRQDLVEQLAQGIHEQYVLTQLDAGVALNSKPAMALWTELGEDLKSANRSQAADIGKKLHLIGATVAPLSDGLPGFTFTEAELELLAEAEHARWLDERRASGWRHGAVRDDRRRRNPAMVDWAVLPADQREKDREAVRALPTVLADAGLRIVRL